MKLPAWLRRIARGSFPFLRGKFSYYGQRVHFPLGSHIFIRACEPGGYEPETTELIIALAKAGTTYIDVGANIGLLSIPVLTSNPGVKVISIEASPGTLSFLRKTWATATRRDDWIIVGTAVGASSGTAEFWTGSGAQGAFDGLLDTGRGGPKHPISVKVSTIDDIWTSNGRPLVSVLKIDIEGGESQALLGARACIAATRPTIILEWTERNLRAYGVQSDALLSFCEANDYQAFAVPGLMHADSKATLRLAMATTETFLLAPTE